MNEQRTRAYQAGAQIARHRMEAEAPLDAEALRAVQASDIVVVEGCYDHVHLVLSTLDMPFTLIGAHQVDGLRLRPEQLLIVNCPGQVSERAVGKVRDFVASGGSLFSTDWALRHVIEPAFPDTIAYNERPTADDVVRIEVAYADNPFMKGVIDQGENPLWWLEGSSYPIRVLDADRVQVIARSKELEDKYGESPVAVLFPYGRGEVFHMISHYYLQRTELREQRHRAPATSYAKSKGVEVNGVVMEDLAAGDVESAAASSRYMANVIAHHKKRQKR